VNTSSQATDKQETCKTPKTPCTRLSTFDNPELRTLLEAWDKIPAANRKQLLGLALTLADRGNCHSSKESGARRSGDE
jgi:hypothetical protein